MHFFVNFCIYFLVLLNCLTHNATNVVSEGIEAKTSIQEEKVESDSTMEEISSKILEMGSPGE